MWELLKTVILENSDKTNNTTKEKKLTNTKKNWKKFNLFKLIFFWILIFCKFEIDVKKIINEIITEIINE